MFKDKYQYGQNVQLLNIQGKSKHYLPPLYREGADKEMDGQWLHQESIWQVCEGLCLYYGPEFKALATAGHKAPRVVLDLTFSELAG